MLPLTCSATCLLVAGVMTAVMAGEVAAGDVNYITSPKFGNFLLARGKLITPEEAFITTTVKGLCSCMMACMTGKMCVAAAAMAVAGGGKKLECRLTDKKPTEATLTDHPDATYIFWQDTIPSGTYHNGRDGLLYLVLDEKVTFNKAKELCGSIPGHRLAITKTDKQVDAVVGIHSETGLELWVDLAWKEKPKNLPVWGDGTVYQGNGDMIYEQENGGVGLRLYNNTFNGKQADYTTNPLCQAKQHGLEW